MGRFEIQDEQYVFPYHYLMYGNAPTKTLEGHLWYKSATDVIVGLVKKNEAKKVLDVGCGDGCLLNVLANSYNADLYGVDMSKRAIQLANAINENIDFECKDFTTIEDTFDCITCVEVLEHISDDLLPSFIKGLSDKLEPRGKLIVTVPTIAKPVHPKHYRHYDLKLLEDEFAQYAPKLSIVDVKYMNKESAIVREYSKNRILIPWLEKRLEKYYLRKCLYGNDAIECIRMLVVMQKE